jgi:hypothetical protein
MTRKYADCRDYPDQTGCTVYLSGEGEQIIRAVTEHAASVHGEQLTHEQIEGMLNDELVVTHA